jgi:predicted HTH domain antitoxin
LQDEKGVATLSKAIEEMRKETAEKERVQIAIDMIKDGQLSFEKISLYTKLTVEKIKELAKMQDTAGKTMNNTIK